MRTMTCEVCATAFSYKYTKKRPRRFCSRTCRSIGQTKVGRPQCSNCAEREARCRGLCLRCYKRRTSKHGLCGRPQRVTKCSICGSSKVKARTWCNRHYESFRRWGDPETVDHKVDEIYVNGDGYLMTWQRGLIHRKVMEERLGRPLKKGEVVHHIDGDKTNPSDTNLHLFANNAEHQLTHASLETCAFELFRLGLIDFDQDRGRYTLPTTIFCETYGPRDLIDA